MDPTRVGSDYLNIQLISGLIKRVFLLWLTCITAKKNEVRHFLAIIG